MSYNCLQTESFISESYHTLKSLIYFICINTDNAREEKIASPINFDLRTYIIYNINAPKGLVVHGIRTYILQEMRGRIVGGSVQRICTEEYGQCIRLKCVCNVETHGIITKFLEDTDFWNWQHHGTEVVHTMSEKFSIIDSTSNTICGTGSDEAKNYKHINSASRSASSGSSKSAKGSR